MLAVLKVIELQIYAMMKRISYVIFKPCVNSNTTGPSLAVRRPRQELSADIAA